jgi:hypothetical protein
MQRLLRAGIDDARYHLGWNFERVDQNGDGVACSVSSPCRRRLSARS